MSDHLPECIALAVRMEYDDAFCICPEVRACEARVREEEERGNLGDRARARREALDAARDAVADHRVPWPTATGDLVNEGIDAALAAIDALRGES